MRWFPKSTFGRIGLLIAVLLPINQLSHARQPLLRDKLINLARGRDYSALERSIDVQVSRLRRLIEPDASSPRYIQTVWGVGYVFVPDGDDG